jgi:transposase
MRTICIDLAVKASHNAVVMEEGEFVTPFLKFKSTLDDIEWLVAREGLEPDHPIQAVMEPTGMAWFTVALPLLRMGVKVFLFNSRKVHDLKRYYKRYASSDRISARVLASLPLFDRESLHPFSLPEAHRLACQRGCKQLERLERLITATKKRIRDTDRFAWPGLEDFFNDIFCKAARLFRKEWYDSAKVIEAGVEGLRLSFSFSCLPQ